MIEWMNLIVFIWFFSTILREDFVKHEKWSIFIVLCNENSKTFKLKFGLFIDLLFSGFQSIIFTFILQICDMDNDNVLNDIELNEFQVCYFCSIYVIDVLIYWNPSVTEALPKIKIKIVFFFTAFFVTLIFRILSHRVVWSWFQVKLFLKYEVDHEKVHSI